MLKIILLVLALILLALAALGVGTIPRLNIQTFPAGMFFWLLWAIA